MSRLGGAVSSSSMISLQRSMHSSQMYTPGPAISFFTCRCDLPQKLQRSCSVESVGRPIRAPTGRSGWSSSLASGSSVGVNHLVDDPILLRLVGAHEEVALGVLCDLLQRLARVVGDDLVEPGAQRDDLLGV